VVEEGLLIHIEIHTFVWVKDKPQCSSTTVCI